jgi:hypothetical protein
VVEILILKIGGRYYFVLDLDLDEAYAYVCPSDLELRVLRLGQVHHVSTDLVQVPNDLTPNEDVRHHSTVMVQVEIFLV